MIDSRAVVDPSARLADDVEVGPYAVIGADVEMGPGCRVDAHALVQGPAVFGRDNRIHSFATVGGDPQDKKYAGEPTRLIVGDCNVFREYCSVHRGTVQDEGETRIGDDNLIMAYVHIAHDCVVGNHVIFSNNASLAGHARIGDHAILSGFTLVHQFCSLGAHCFTGMGSAVAKDVPPYMMVNGSPARARSINTEGLKRRGFSAQAIQQLRKAYKLLYRSKLPLDEAVVQLEAMIPECEEVRPLVEFIKSSNRSILR